MKKFICFALIICVLSTCLCGCGKEEDFRKNGYFAKLNFDDRCEFIEQYLQTEYSINAKVNDVTKRAISAMQSEDMYYAEAICENGDTILCWITDDGIITDGKFINDLFPDIDNFIVQKVYQITDSYDIYMQVTLNQPAQKEWTKDNIQEMLSTEDITINIRMFMYESQRDVLDDYTVSSLTKALEFAKGSLYIYFLPDNSNVDTNKYDLEQFDMHLTF